MRRRWTYTGIVAAAIASLSGFAIGPALSTHSQSVATTSALPAAHVWTTTPDGKLKLADEGTVPFTDSRPTAPSVTVDPSRTYQTIDGFGGAITDSSAGALYRLSQQQRSAAMQSLFDPRNGDGLSYLRQPMGASDFVQTAAYTYDDIPAGRTDYGLQHFSIAHDQAQILPLLREARGLNPHLQIVATPWSPPAWMKTNDSLTGGRLIDDPHVYAAYARYFVKFIEAYRAAGVTVNAITLQNEPQNRTPSGYPGTDMSAAQEERLAEAVGPALRAAGLNVEILAYDHNWSEHPNDIAATPPDESSDINDYPQEVLSDPAAAKWVSGVAYHCYYGDPSAMSTLHNQYPDKDIYFTECSGSQSTPPTDTFSDTLTWHARNLIIGATRNWAKTVINWNVALDPSGGPHVGGCSTCTGILTIGPGQSVQRNAEYYTLGQISRFVRPGAVRIASTSFGTTGWNGEVMDVAFRNPDGSTALVAHNENDNPTTFAVTENGHSFTYTLPGGALTTFVWSASPGLETGPHGVDPTGWTAVAQPSGPSGDAASNAVDDDASTRYSTGRPQQPGQYLQMDFGKPIDLDRLVLDSGTSTGDHPRGYAVTASTDGRTWSPVLGRGAGTGQLTTIDLPMHHVRYVRITLTASSARWWSVADVRGYRV